MRKSGFIPVILLVVIFIVVGIGSAAYYTITVSHKTEATVTPTPNLPKDTLIPPSNKFDNKLLANATPTPVPTSTLLPSVTNKPDVSLPLMIKGDENCKVKTQEALDLLQNKASVFYKTVLKYIGVIECVDKGSGMYAWESPPRYQVGKATYEAGAIWYAGTIVHDSCHSKLYIDYLSSGNSSVPDNVWTGREAEKTCLTAQYSSLVEIGASQSVLDYVSDGIDSNYWDVDVSNRWW